MVENGEAQDEMISPTLNPQKGLIFRVSHRDNLPWILDHGLHARNGAMFDPNFRTIGNLELISKRPSRAVPIGMGGTLSDYIPFYFTPFSKMMFNIHTGFNVARVPNEEIAILVSSLPVVSKLGIPFVFSDQHALLKTASYFSDPKDLDRLDWAIWNGRDFKHDPDDPGKAARYQAEALVWKHLPVAGLISICSYSTEVDGWLKSELAKRNLNVATNIQRNWYFQ